MEFCSSFSSRAEPQSHVPSELRKLHNILIKKAMLQWVENTLDGYVYTDLNVADTVVKHAFFCFEEMAITGMAHHGKKIRVISKSSERWTLPETLTNKLR